MKEIPIFIAIDGHGGSGKSTFAKELSKNLCAEIIHVDDFTGLGSLDSWYETLISKIIRPVFSGAKTLSYPRAKWWPEHRTEPIVNQPVTPIMIIEGTGSSRKELREFTSLKIFVDTPQDVCLKRGLKRDGGMGGKTDAEIVAQWNQWIKWDNQYFEKHNPKAYADIIVDGMKPLNDSVLKKIQLLCL